VRGKEKIVIVRRRAGQSPNTPEPCPRTVTRVVRHSLNGLSGCSITHQKSEVLGQSTVVIARAAYNYTIPAPAALLVAVVSVSALLQACPLPSEGERPGAHCSLHNAHTRQRRPAKQSAHTPLLACCCTI